MRHGQGTLAVETQRSTHPILKRSNDVVVGGETSTAEVVAGNAIVVLLGLLRHRQLVQAGLTLGESLDVEVVAKDRGGIAAVQAEMPFAHRSGETPRHENLHSAINRRRGVTRPEVALGGIPHRRVITDPADRVAQMV